MMDWKLFSATFISIFIAEMGDKTQFAALAAGANTNSFWTVTLAVVLALSLAGVLGVYSGRELSVLLKPEWLKWISGSIFIALGIWTFVKN